MRSRALLPLATVVVTALAAACNEGTGPTDGFVVTGPLQNNTQAAIPAEARLVAVWSVTSVALFDTGYSVGVGVKAPAGAVFDTFQPASQSSPRLIIDDPANIEVVNWT